MNRQEIIDEVVTEISKEKNIPEHEVGTYDVTLRLSDRLVNLLNIPGVVSSLPSKEAMNKKVNTLIFENFEDDEIANRREYGFGFRVCYRWVVNELKHK